MPDGLAGAGAVVDDDSKILQTLLLRDLTRDPVEMTDDFFVMFGHIGESVDMHLRDDQDMSRRLWIDVVKRDTQAIPMDDLGWSVLGGDSTKEAVLGHGCYFL